MFRKLHYWRKPGERVVVLASGKPCRHADLLIYERDSLDVRRQKRIEAEDEYFRKLSAAWSEALRSAFAKIDEFKL